MAVVVWNLAVVVWLVAGHPGIASSTGEGTIGAAITIIALWLVGNALTAVVRVATRRRRSRHP